MERGGWDGLEGIDGRGKGGEKKEEDEIGGDEMR